MENEKPDVLDLRLNPVHGLKKDTRQGADPNNKNYYLYKNGKMMCCPFRQVATSDGIYPTPCGEDCQHFHYMPETKKIQVPINVEDATAGIKDKIVETGGLFVRLTCGSGANGNGTLLLINGAKLGGVKSEPKV